MVSITKTAVDPEVFARPVRAFANARSALKAFLQDLQIPRGEQVLLPSYVGWSPREGSGVFDPIQELELPCAFYRLDGRLRIDLHSLETHLRRKRVKVVVLIHYFGYVDPAYRAAVNLAHRYGALVLEDEAHAWLTDWVGGACGRAGDACIASLHKLLPIPHGGLLIGSETTRDLVSRMTNHQELLTSAMGYDLARIAQQRRENANYLGAHLDPLREFLVPLWEEPARNEVPQTFPVLVQGVSRDQVYSHMNQAGFGVVSLYHTMIREIGAEEFPDSHRVARCILNLPVHQDISRADLESLLEQLSAVCHALKEPMCHALSR